MKSPVSVTVTLPFLVCLVRTHFHWPFIVALRIWVPIYEVLTRKHLTLVTLEENLEMAADIGLDATASVDEAFAAAMERHGPNAKLIVLPYARYQLPRNAVRLDVEPLRFPQEAHA